MVFEDISNMTLKDVVSCYTGDTLIPIIIRCNSPVHDEYDMLYGYCSYDPITKELLSEDGDDYSLDSVIENFQVAKDQALTVWVHAEWVSGKEYNTMINGRRAKIQEGERK